MQPNETSICTCDIGLSVSHYAYKAFNHHLAYSPLADFFLWFPLMKLHGHWGGYCPRLIHSEHCQVHQNVTLLMDVNGVIILSMFNQHAKIGADTPKIMYPEPLLCLILALPHIAHIHNAEKMIDIEISYGNDVALSFTMQHQWFSISMRCDKPNHDHEVIEWGMSMLRRLL